MALAAIIGLHCLVAFASIVFQKGQTSVIEYQQTVMAAIGDSAFLNCQLMQSKDVTQVTWQKILPEGKTDLATYNKDFGEIVMPGYQGRVEFIDAGLQNSSIVIRNVMDQDEGYYRCLFNNYPDGAFTATTYLQLYELHEAFLHVRESSSSEELVVSCSATGRPAPTVTLTVPHCNSTSVTNTNGTVTVTTTAELSRLHGNSTRVGCTARVLSGPQRVVYEPIPEVKPVDGVDVESGSDAWIIAGVVGVLCVAAAAAALTVFFKRRHQNREIPQRNPQDFLESVSVSQGDSEENKKDTHERPRTPLMKSENTTRLRTSTEKNKSNLHPKSSMKGKNLFPVPQDDPQD